MNDRTIALVKAVRGPLVLIALGVLFAIDHFGVVSFRPNLAGTDHRDRHLETGGVRGHASAGLRRTVPGEDVAMRRGSIVGPLLLIAVGGLFLANNLRPDLSLLQVISEYWPYLLIAWGVLRLIEIGAWYFSEKPLPERGVSGGEWTFVIFLALIGSGMFAIHRHWGLSPMHWRIQGIEMFGEPYDFPIAEQKVASSKAPRIIIENFRGNARIAGTDADEVKVSGRKTVRSMRIEDAQAGDRSTQLEIQRAGRRDHDPHQPGDGRLAHAGQHGPRDCGSARRHHSGPRPDRRLRRYRHQRERRDRERQRRGARAEPRRQPEVRSAEERHHPRGGREGRASISGSADSPTTSNSRTSPAR